MAAEHAAVDLKPLVDPDARKFLDSIELIVKDGSEWPLPEEYPTLYTDPQLNNAKVLAKLVVALFERGLIEFRVDRISVVGFSPSLRSLGSLG